MSEFKSRFSIALNRQLIEYYGRIPSASILARDFNLRAKNSSPITAETARRWIRGLSLPDIDKLATLSNWLNIHIQINNAASPNNPQAQEIDTNYKIQVGHGLPARSTLNESELFLLKVFRETDIRGKQIFLAIAKTLTSG